MLSPLTYSRWVAPCLRLKLNTQPTPLRVYSLHVNLNPPVEESGTLIKVIHKSTPLESLRASRARTLALSQAHTHTCMPYNTCAHIVSNYIWCRMSRNRYRPALSTDSTRSSDASSVRTSRDVVTGASAVPARGGRLRGRPVHVPVV